MAVVCAGGYCTTVPDNYPSIENLMIGFMLVFAGIMVIWIALGEEVETHGN